jgi:K+-sensing histidine kinase KdpD
VRGTAAQGVPGAGLGLPLVRAIVARHGGHCELRSQPGAGTAVRIWLPAFRTPPGAGTAPACTQMATPGPCSSHSHSSTI